MDKRVIPAEDNTREQATAAYMEKHRILELLDNMTSMLIYAQPGNQETMHSDDSGNRSKPA